MWRLAIVLALLSCPLIAYGQGQGAPADARLQQIEQAIEKYGKRPLIEFIRSKKSGYITLSVGNEFRTYYGPPNPVYVTAQTILNDLDALRIPINTVVAELEQYSQKRRKMEEQRQEAEAERAGRQVGLRETAEGEKRRTQAAQREAQAAQAQEGKNRRKADSEEKSRVPAFGSKPSNASSMGWNILRTKDAMTDHTSCVIESLPFLGRDRGEFIFATLRIVHTTAGFIVGFYGRSRGIIGPPPTFHTDIDGLGIRIDTFPFIPVDHRSGTRLLAFLPEKSAQIIQQLSQAKTAKMRVRFWPYEETVDMEDEKMDLSGFAEGLEALKGCSASAR